MIGRRVPDYTPHHELEPGDYGRARNLKGGWWFITPNGLNGAIDSRWAVAEHEDRTISVAPSIDVNGGDLGRWHGWLERGIWREA